MVSIEPSGLRKQERNDNLLDDPDSNEAARKIRYDTKAAYWRREPWTELIQAVNRMSQLRTKRHATL
jgi:hypothetical protein